MLGRPKATFEIEQQQELMRLVIRCRPNWRDGLLFCLVVGLIASSLFPVFEKGFSAAIELIGAIVALGAFGSWWVFKNRRYPNSSDTIEIGPDSLMVKNRFWIWSRAHEYALSKVKPFRAAQEERLHLVPGSPRDQMQDRMRGDISAELDPDTRMTNQRNFEMVKFDFGNETIGFGPYLTADQAREVAEALNEQLASRGVR